MTRSSSTAATGLEGAPVARAPRLEALLTAEAPRLLSYFARRARPADDAADLVSETMIVAWRRRDVVPRDDVEARMWLFGVARKVLATHRRGILRHHALADRLRGEIAVSVTAAAADGSPDRQVGPLVDDLREALEHLSAPERDLVALVHWDGFSLAEAAALLGQRPGTVRSRYHRARARLRAQLESRGR